MTIKRNIFYLILSTIGILSILFVLLQAAPIPNNFPNGFTRKWSSITVNEINSVKYSAPLDKIAGITTKWIYFRVPNPTQLVTYDHNLNLQDTVGFGLPFPQEDIGANHIQVDSPDVYFFALNLPAFYAGQLNDTAIRKSLRTPNVFTRCEGLSKEYIILRSFDSASRGQQFQKIETSTGKIVNHSNLLYSENQMGFDGDGWLRHDNNTNRIYYIEIYRNVFYCLDSNLNSIYAAHTIDTMTTNEVKMKKMLLDGEERIIPAKPRIIVNKDCAISDGLLFIASSLKADNEQRKDFKNNITIDIYSLEHGEYKGSIHLPLKDGQSLKSFTVKNKILVALYQGKIVTYKIDY